MSPDHQEGSRGDSEMSQYRARTKFTDRFGVGAQSVQYRSAILEHSGTKPHFAHLSSGDGNLAARREAVTGGFRVERDA
jgi:hypothetical protein